MCFCFFVPVLYSSNLILSTTCGQLRARATWEFLQHIDRLSETARTNHVTINERHQQSCALFNNDSQLVFKCTFTITISIIIQSAAQKRKEKMIQIYLCFLFFNSTGDHGSSQPSVSLTVINVFCIVIIPTADGNISDNVAPWSCGQGIMLESNYRKM